MRFLSLKNIFLVIAVVAFFLILYEGAKFLGWENKDSDNDISTTFPSVSEEVVSVTPEVVIEDDNKKPLLTKSGSLVYTDNFLETENARLVDSAFPTYLLAEEISISGTVFEIYYFGGGGVLVSLLDEDLHYARASAEEKLRDIFSDMTTIEICSLMVTVNTPANVSDYYSGINLGLSFCPGSLELN